MAISKLQEVNVNSQGVFVGEDADDINCQGVIVGDKVWVTIPVGQCGTSLVVSIFSSNITRILGSNIILSLQTWSL